MTLTFEAALDRITAALGAGPRLRLAVLFGSAADGTLRPDSDIDIAILPEDPDMPFATELGLQTALVRASNREVDLIRLDLARTLVRWQVARYGRAIFESGPYEAARFRAASVAEYLDFAPAFDRAAERFRQRLVARAGR